MFVSCFDKLCVLKGEKGEQTIREWNKNTILALTSGICFETRRLNLK
jgi:hypothetical protein